MRTRFRHMTEKYKWFRHQPDGLFLSRLIQTAFNKFTKNGKKALARRHIHAALERVRYYVNHLEMFYILTRLLRELHLQLIFAFKRKGKQILEVPVPVRRNKGEVLAAQTLYNAIKARRERDLSERIEQEVRMLTLHQSDSSTLRERTRLRRHIYQERTNMEERYK